MRLLRIERIFLILAAVVISAAANLTAGWKDEIGWTLLSNELGPAMPDGTNVTVSQIEGEVGAEVYFPNTNDPAFAGKVFNDKTGTHISESYHASTVGSNFYGSGSAAPGIGYIDVYKNSDWLNDGFLQPGPQNSEPLVETNRVQNHSWVATSSTASNYIRRLDYAIDRDGFTCVVGVNNTTNPHPELLSYTYNGISVGKTAGTQSSGLTTNDVAGRVKPEIVGPANYTSWTTPMVGSCAALLIGAADELSMTNGSLPQTVKALLLAGATKSEFTTNWDRTASRPLDERFGAGELNIYNSWHMLTNGEQNSSATSLVNHIGWDYEALTAATSRWYFFDVPADHAASRFSTVLTWHRKITNGLTPPQFRPDASLANLDLALYEATDFTVGTLVDQSTSQVDNVEHIFQESLAGGRYALKVSAEGEAKYALAWYKAPAAIPEFLAAVYEASTGFVMEVSTSPNVLYGIQATTNLLNDAAWTNLASSTPVTSLWTFIDTEATNYLHRFYKAYVNPE